MTTPFSSSEIKSNLSSEKGEDENNGKLYTWLISAKAHSAPSVKHLGCAIIACDFIFSNIVIFIITLPSLLLFLLLAVVKIWRK